MSLCDITCYSSFTKKKQNFVKSACNEICISCRGHLGRYNDQRGYYGNSRHERGFGRSLNGYDFGFGRSGYYGNTEMYENPGYNGYGGYGRSAYGNRGYGGYGHSAYGNRGYGGYGRSAYGGYGGHGGRYGGVGGFGRRDGAYGGSYNGGYY